MNITISGVPGSGKTSAGRMLAERLGMKFYSIGELRAKMAEERGLTIDALNKLGETDPSTDTDIDEYQKQLGAKEDGLVIEGRLSWHFIPSSFKIFLDCDRDEAARRIFLAKRDGERQDEALYEDERAARESLDKRMASDERRYHEIYGLDYRDASHFDAIIDTTDASGPDVTAERMYHALKEHGLA